MAVKTKRGWVDVGSAPAGESRSLSLCRALRKFLRDEFQFRRLDVGCSGNRIRLRFSLTQCQRRFVIGSAATFVQGWHLVI